jgi:hypothetical protein
MPRLNTLTAGFLALLLFSFGVATQSTTPTPALDVNSGDATALAKTLQNPIGDHYSFPFQNNTWTMPVGAQIGHVVKIGGKLPVNFLVGAYYNALRPQRETSELTLSEASWRSPACLAPMR